MKTIKLILIFVVILGGVVGAFFLIGKGGDLFNTSVPNKTYETYSTQFTNDWEAIDDWDESLFLKNSDIIRMLSNDYDTRPLSNKNTELAIEIVHRKVFEEWNYERCDRNVVEKYINAVKVIKDEDSLASDDPNLIQIDDVYETYKSAIALASMRIGISPTFNGNSWNSFDDYSIRIKEKKNNMLENANYKEYLSNIIDIKNAIDNIDTKLAEERVKFYDKLAAKIVSYFGATPNFERTRDQLNVLTGIRSKYENETYSRTTLTEFVKAFRMDVNNNENRAADDGRFEI